MVMVFWDCGGMILLDMMQRGRTFNSDTYISMLEKMRKCFQHIWPVKNLCHVASVQ
jgi:Transposase.